MRVYARPGWRMARQLFGDVLVLGWLVLWGALGWWVMKAVQTMEEPARRSGEAAQQMSDQLGQARDRIQGFPSIGDELASPFGSMVGGLEQLSVQAQAQVELVHRMSWLAGGIVFLVPALCALAVWLPRRIRFVNHAAAARRYIDADADLELFALRAMANLPMEAVARVSADPVGRWRAGDQDVIRALAALELERTGLGLPASVRSRG